MSDEVWRREEIESPCVKTCVIDPVSRLCLGCRRTIDEIAGWSRMGAAARSRVMAELPGREAAARPVRRGGRAARRGDTG